MIRGRSFKLLFGATGTRSIRGGASERPDADAKPLRAELLCVAQVARHGQALARLHVLGKGGRTDPLLRRLDDNERGLIATFSVHLAAIRPEAPQIVDGALAAHAQPG